MESNSKNRNISVRANGTESGFSMIELLVVIVIIGMLAGMVTLNVIGQQQKANRKAALAQIKLFEDAFEVYRLDNGKYPSSDKGLQSLIDGEYIKERKLPKDPWGNEYQYVSPGPSGYPFDIVSYGNDGQEGGSGDAADISLSGGLGNEDDEEE
jgi:general secretion pathway protein G